MSGVKIGVFDSGLGGLSVVRALFSVNPDASIIYFADTAHVPYGDRPGEQVRGFALGIIDYLLAEGAGAILMACNMSSAVALDDARRIHPDIPVIGVIQAGARAAARLSQHKIAVLATAGTVASGGYLRAIAAEAPSVQVIQTGCPQFVPLIESGQLTGPRVEDAVKECLQSGLDAGAKVFVLGCTHYPFLVPCMRELCPPDTAFVDPAEEAVREILAQTGDQIDERSPSRFVLSAPSETFRPVGSRFLGQALPELEIVPWAPGDLKLSPARGSQLAAL